MPAGPYRPSIDGLRAIAVLAVFVFHLNRSWLPGGFFGVDIFFVISGYLITSIIVRDCQGERFRFRRFYQRRIARLLPAFVAVAVATLAGAALIYSPQDLASTGSTLSAAAASVANLKFLLQGNYFALSPDSQPFLHCWSLSVEEQFYLLFPAVFLLMPRRRRGLWMAGLFVASLVCYAAMTPQWAFYLLPARAWELMAGGLLAVAGGKGLRWGSLGLVLIGFSFLDGRGIVLAVAGACLVLSANVPVLSWRPLAAIGRISYSLYLWHWPIFALVDYRLLWQPLWVRLALKIGLSFGAAVLSYWLIEQPGRVVLNRPERRWLAFGALAGSLAILVPLGILVRNANYLNADAREVRTGGLHLNSGGRSGSLVLMGDSHGSMYGRVAQEVARGRDLRLDVISVEAGDPLPRSSGENPALWTDSLAVVKRMKPDFLMLVCNWDKLKDDPGRLSLALRELRPYAGSVILVTQPPVLPENASREAIRNGSRPPFVENAGEREVRMARNGIVKSLQDGRVRVVDIEPLFSRASGEIRFVDGESRLLFQDPEHLSAAGASLVGPALMEAISSPSACRACFSLPSGRQPSGLGLTASR
jgi:peptidoglycan/LPS O-acetylase OafA/YrhL